MQGFVPSQKKQVFPISSSLKDYLIRYGYYQELPFHYDDLLRFTISIPLVDFNEQDTFWETVYYDEKDQKELFKQLTKIYAILKTDGDIEAMEHLQVSRIDFCTFGNSKPFRVRILNLLNDNYDHFYIKKGDASRVYGLELENILSPNYINYIVYEQTLVIEHIAGLPGDLFIKENLEVTEFNRIRIIKEFVKFNERCFIRLLGDMRSYNFIVDITPDIEGYQYRMRAIDFDQQCYEGKKSFYLPQFFKENNPLIFLGLKYMKKETIKQYQLEERSMFTIRARSMRTRLRLLIKSMAVDQISQESKVYQLKHELAAHHKTDRFLKCISMGEILRENLRLVFDKEFKQSILI